MIYYDQRLRAVERITAQGGEIGIMVQCHEMKKGDIYVCQDCGIELQVVKDCKDAETMAEVCGCKDSSMPCTFSCCGKELVKKQA